MNGIILHVVGDGLTVDGLAHYVPDAPKGRGTNGHHHGVPGVLDAKPALQAVGRRHGDGANDVVCQLGLDLEHRLHASDGRVIVNEKCRVNRGNLVDELDVDNRSDDTDDASLADALVELVVGGLLKGGAHLFGGFCH